MNKELDIIVRPCAKINLGLYVTARRPDGYHNLETIFYPIPLTDELHITLGQEADELLLDGIALDGNPKDNLVMRAVALLRSEGCSIPPLRIELTKNIPSGAGLGGGSSDAAFTVRALNEALALGLSAQRMRELVVRLGADCPFFITDEPMYATGIGDVLSPVSVDLRGYYLTLIKPDDFVSTREAYAGIRPAPARHSLRQSIATDVREWQVTVANNFERSIFPLHPAIAQVKQQLLDAGALYACMSGSGSTVFGIFQRPTRIATPYFQFDCAL